MASLAKHLPELERLTALIDRLGAWARVETLANVELDAQRLPVHALVLGPDDTTIPTFALIGGIHGLERIGTEVVLSYLTTITNMLSWDTSIARELEHVRLVFVPLVNPAGMLLRRRANANGVDLMRNAPCDPLGTGSPLVGGQRLSPRLPWYMGLRSMPMEAEAAGLCRFVREQIFAARTSLLIDVHSGFGLIDRLWFPYARTRRPFPGIAETTALKMLIDETLPHHIYRIEPQAHNYTIQGDLWDHLYDEHRRVHPDHLFLPFTLEMGSWSWVRKNPRQIFDTLGSFNPIKPHRLHRALRRHLMLFDVIRRACGSSDRWASFTKGGRHEMEQHALKLWFSP